TKILKIRNEKLNFGRKPNTCEESEQARVWPLECERLRGVTCSFVCSASWKAGELSVIESAVTVLFSDSLSVCVVILCLSYCPVLRAFLNITNITVGIRIINSFQLRDKRADAISHSGKV
ncbi:hypothetical protein AVEN_126845-1, partial [Araneus ventricosus]